MPFISKNTTFRQFVLFSNLRWNCHLFDNNNCWYIISDINICSFALRFTIFIIVNNVFSEFTAHIDLYDITQISILWYLDQITVLLFMTKNIWVGGYNIQYLKCTAVILPYFQKRIAKIFHLVCGYLSASVLHQLL